MKLRSVHKQMKDRMRKQALSITWHTVTFDIWNNVRNQNFDTQVYLVRAQVWRQINEKLP